MTGDAAAPATAFDRQRAAMAVTITTGPEKAVLLVLAIMANATGEAWPAVSGPNGIGARASLCRRTVQAALRGLEAKSLIRREDRPGKGAVYTLTIDEGVRISCACASPAHGQDARRGAHLLHPNSQEQPEPISGGKSPSIGRARKPTVAKPAGSRGTRLAADFEPPGDWIEWAVSERGWDHARASAVADDFRDYWVAKTGADAAKADWLATWRRWVRKTREEMGYGQRGNSHHRRTGAAGRGTATDAVLTAFDRVSFEG